MENKNPDNESNSLLDKIIQSKQKNEAYQFYPHDIASEFLNNLSPKENKVLSKRFGLKGEDTHTLEQIGKEFKITRERIRQIQNTAIKKIKELDSMTENIDFINQTIVRLLQEYGGIMEENHFLNKLISFSNNSVENRRAAEFIITQLMGEKMEKIKKSENLLPGWKLKVISLDMANQVLENLEKITEDKDKLLELHELLDALKETDFYKENKEHFLPFGGVQMQNSTQEKAIDKAIQSYLRISSKVNNNLLNLWGLTRWPTITPKRMGDKIYLILTKIGKPLHFTDIADEINKAKFDKKIAYPATIHNELILDDRYVLVGRGIYALKKWGYNSGTVSDVIKEILQNSDTGLTKQEILDLVSKKRMVKKSTIYLALSNKKHFKKVGSKYTVV